MADFRMAKLGRQLRELRKAKSLSLRRLAELVNSEHPNHPLMIKYEKGRHQEPTLKVLSDIARVLGVRYFDLQEFLLRQLPDEESPEFYEEKVFQLELPFEAVAKISCKRVGDKLVVSTSVLKKRKTRR